MEVLDLKYCILVTSKYLIRSEHFIVTLSFLNYSEKVKTIVEKCWHLDLMETKCYGSFS